MKKVYNTGMKYLEEENKNLMNLRTSLIPVIVVISGGIVGLLLADVNLFLKMFLIIIGSYLDFLFVSNTIYANNKINKNIGEIKNDCK